jgi:AraC-like DNA-binding protein
MAAAGNESARHRLLEYYLDRLCNSKNGQNRLLNVLHGVDLVHANQGNVSMSFLQRECLMSERNFRRRFTEYVGMSPKQYAGIIRIKEFCKRHDSVKGNITGLLPELGYMDYAHFSKDFQKIVGTSPGNYFSHWHQIDSQYLHLI